MLYVQTLDVVPIRVAYSICLQLQGARLEYSSLGESSAARSHSRSAPSARRLSGAGSLSAGAAAVSHMLDGDGGDDHDSGNAAVRGGVPDASTAASAAASLDSHAARSNAAAARTASNSSAALPSSDSVTLPRSARASQSGGSGLTAVASSSGSGDDIGAKKEAIKASMARLARELKENTQRIAAALAADRSTLDETEAAAAGNVSTLRADNAKLRAQSESGCGTTWLAFGALAFAALVFVLMYVFMKIFPKPRVAVGAS
jgi:hypothetical protein